MTYEYEHDGEMIYRQSFATIREEADLSAFHADIAQVVVRMIHTCGQVDLVRDIEASSELVSTCRAALLEGAPVLCDATMVAAGITRSRLPADNEIACLLQDPRVPAIARSLGTTRSAAALDLWGARLNGSVVAIGNAPTALFRLLELLDAGAPTPAAIIGVPVGFVGAAESKRALADHGMRIPFLTVHGRRGGSSLAAAAVNALATEHELMPA